MNWQETTLSTRRIEAIVRKRFPVFDLDDDDEEGRKETTIELLSAQAEASFKAGARDCKGKVQALNKLSRDCFRFLRQLDELIKTITIDNKDGKAIAQLANWLEYTNDSVRYSYLGVDFRKDDKDKEWDRIKNEVLIR